MIDLLYIICTTPRTGTTALLDILRQIPSTGNPREWPEVKVVNGVCGVMIHAAQLDNYKTVFPQARTTKYIYIYREDAVAQAVSWSKAAQTGKWHSYHQYGSDFEFKDLSVVINRINTDNKMWRSYLAGKYPLILTYEEFNENNAYPVEQILAFLGMDRNIEIPESRLSIMRDEKNDEWKEWWNAKSV